MRLSPNFTLREFTFSQTAVNHGIDNTPTPEILERLKQTAQGMERVRNNGGGNPVIVLSGYRSPDVNKAVGGSRNSAHMQGWACDFFVRGINNRQVCQAIIANGIKFDQLILEGVSDARPNGSWVHISFDPTMRGQVLTMKRENGRITYKKGLVR